MVAGCASKAGAPRAHHVRMSNSHVAALLSVCRLTHTESLPLFYRSRTFRFPTLTPSLAPIFKS
ncbi:hypothetical protein ABVK25_010408 [Lepraria finkii]|uniref:Uncharacterized protein n=1 Tax=Lepraria finkii TaxID=1340010 RepID=A0ABR4AWW9_9LECA